MLEVIHCGHVASPASDAKNHLDYQPLVPFQLVLVPVIRAVLKWASRDKTTWQHQSAGGGIVGGVQVLNLSPRWFDEAAKFKKCVNRWQGPEGRGPLRGDFVLRPSALGATSCSE